MNNTVYQIIQQIFVRLIIQQEQQEVTFNEYILI